MLNSGKRKYDDKQRPNHNGMYSGSDVDSDLKKASFKSKLNNLILALEHYDETRYKAIKLLKDIYKEYGDEILEENVIKNIMQKPHIKKLITYYLNN